MFWMFILLLFNYGISWWNAVVAGKAWEESKAVGGFIRLVVWSAAIQSAAGFSMVYTAIIGAFLYWIGYLGPEEVELLFSYWYVMAVPAILGSGFVIMIHSWQQWWRDRSLLNLGVSAYNTYAMGHNAVQAFDGMGRAIGDIADAFKPRRGSDGKGAAALVVLLIALIGVLLGILHTVALIKRYAGTVSLPDAVTTHTSRPRAV